MPNKLALSNLDNTCFLLVSEYMNLLRKMSITSKVLGKQLMFPMNEVKEEKDDKLLHFPTTFQYLCNSYISIQSVLNIFPTTFQYLIE